MAPTSYASYQFRELPLSLALLQFDIEEGMFPESKPCCRCLNRFKSRMLCNEPNSPVGIAQNSFTQGDARVSRMSRSNDRLRVPLPIA